MKRALLWIAVLALSWGCSNREIDLSDKSSSVIVTGILASVPPEATLLEVNVAIDGKSAAKATYDQAVDSVNLYGMRGGKSGAHTIQIGVDRQTRASVNYTLTNVTVSLADCGIFTCNSASVTRTIPDRQVTMAPGDVITINVNL